MFDQTGELPHILINWAELLEQDQPDRFSAVSIHARAAAARMILLERAVVIANCFLELRAKENDSVATCLVESALRAALICLDEPIPSSESAAYQFVDEAMKSALQSESA